MSKRIPTCGCQVIHEYDWIHKEREHGINYCLLHAAAPGLLAALEYAVSILNRDGVRPLRGEAFTDTDVEYLQATIHTATKGANT